MSAPETTHHATATIFYMVAAVCVVALTVAALRTLDGVNVAVATVNAPCAPGPCGLLAQMTKTVTKSGDAIVQTQLEERSITPHILATVDALGKVAPHLSQTADSLSRAASSASTAIQGTQAHLEPVLDATADTVTRAGTFVYDMDNSARPLFAKANDTLDGLTALETNPAIPKMLNDGQTISSNFAATTTDFQTKFHLILFPAPCHTFGCKVARVYPYIKDAAQMGSALYWTDQLFQNRAP